MTAVFVIAFILVGTASVLSLTALIRRRSLADRIVAIDLLLLTLVAGIAVGGAWTGRGTYLDVLVVTALLGFVGTITVARFIERRGT